ncbi:alpha/beta fold hydrolase, partial [Singulisphaera rosea]
MPMTTANGLTFHYQQAGTGPDVVLIHGVTGDLSIWFLCRAIQALSESHRVTAYDLRGHGYSEAPPTGYTSSDHAADLFALMDHLE